MQKRGISLIVLVITIIVMIILAAAIIISLNNTGIIGNANKAVDETNKNQIFEMAEISWLEGKSMGKTGDDLNSYVQDGLTKSIPENNLKDYTVLVTDEKVSVMPSSWKDSVIDVVDKVPIPKGFVASSATGENKKGTGLVIYEGEDPVTNANVENAKRTRNQYVWVPVDNMSEFKRKNYGMGAYEDEYKDSSVITEKISNKESDLWEINPNTVIEECTIKNEENADVQVANQKDLEEVKAMYKSVEKYGGFYVARYEAGLETVRTSKDANNVILSSSINFKMNKYLYNYIKFSNSFADSTGGALEAARSVYPNDSSNNTGVVSTLMYGVMWDTTMNWLNKTGAILDLKDTVNNGNFKNHKIGINDTNLDAEYSTDYGKTYSKIDQNTKDDTTYWLLTTGALKAACTNNIYDIAGNAEEWTMEGEGAYYHIARGSTYQVDGNEYPVVYRSIYLLTNRTLLMTFRAALYIK